MNTLTEKVEYLTASGWREYPNALRPYGRHFYKRFDTPTRCRCNDDKAGMQVCCSVSEYDGRVSYELELTGQLPDGTWFKVRQYILPPDIRDGLALIPRLLAVWEYAAYEKASP